MGKKLAFFILIAYIRHTVVSRALYSDFAALADTKGILSRCLLVFIPVVSVAFAGFLRLVKRGTLLSASPPFFCTFVFVFPQVTYGVPQATFLSVAM
jgi:hypothetical protein